MKFKKSIIFALVFSIAASVTGYADYSENDIIYESFNGSIGNFSKDKYASTSFETGKVGKAVKFSNFYEHSRTIRLTNVVLKPNRRYKISYWVKGVTNYSGNQSCIIVKKDGKHTNELGQTTKVPLRNYEYCGAINLTNEWQYVEGYIENRVNDVIDEVGYTELYPMIYTDKGFGTDYEIKYASRVTFMIDEFKVEPLDIIFEGNMSNGVKDFTFTDGIKTAVVKENGNDILSLTCTADGNNDMRTAVSLEEGKKYRMTFRAKTNSGTNSIKPIFSRNSGSLTGEPSTKYQYMTEREITSAWQTFSEEITSPEETASGVAYRYPQLFMRITKKGNVYIDDLRIEPVYSNISNIKFSGKCQVGQTINVSFDGDGSSQYHWRVIDKELYTVISEGDTNTTSFSFPLLDSNDITVCIKSKKASGSYTEEIRTDITDIDDNVSLATVSGDEKLGVEFPDTYWTPDFEKLRAIVNVKDKGDIQTGALAVYDNQGRLVSIDKVDLKEGKNMLEADTKEGTRAKVMLFNEEYEPARICKTIEKDTTSKFIYVANDGTTFNAGKFTRPWKTIEKAITDARTYSGRQNVVIMLKSDVYSLSKPISLVPEDSGAFGKVVYASYGGANGEKAIISGGKQISGWSLFDAEKNIYAANVTDQTITNFRQMYVNGIRADRARTYLAPPVLNETETGYKVIGTSLLGINNVSDAEFVYWYKWTNPRCPISAVTDNGDGTTNVKMNSYCWSLFKAKAHLKPEEPDYVENAYEFMDTPGEWYFDKHQRKLYYIPRSFEDMSTATVTVPCLENLLTVNGTPSKLVKNITFNNIEFAYSNWLYPDQYGYSDAQSGRIRYNGRDNVPSAAVEIKHAQNFNFENCTFDNLGMTAINELWGISNSYIKGCEFYSLAGSGMYVGIPYKYDDNVGYNYMLCDNITISNNYFHDIGLDYNSCVPISLLSTNNTEVSHNEIFDVPYSGICAGYGWLHDMTGISYNNNYVHRVLNGNIEDGGSIYLTGETGGTKDNPNLVEGNYIKEQLQEFGAIYPDEYSNGWRIDNNVVDLSMVGATVLDKIAWLHSNAGSKNYADNNYTTTDVCNLNTRCLTDPQNDPGVFVTNTHINPNAEWNDEAKAIINNAGLTEEYDAGNIGKYQITKSISDNVIVKAGMMKELNLYGEGGKGCVYSPQNIVSMVSGNSDIASVENGIVTGVSKGMTNIEVYTLTDNCLKVTKIPVTVY